MDEWNEILSDFPPRLNEEGLPEAERETARNISSALMSLMSYIESFRDALALFDFCDTLDKRAAGNNAWKFLAARDGAMTIFHIGRAMAAVHEALDARSCPALLAMIDIPALRLARRRLEGLFPDFEELRHSVAHAGDNATNPMLHSVLLRNRSSLP